mgnify:CR=1 FL=1
MKLIRPKFEILEQQPGVDGIYKMIELAGRTCYRSEDKITEDSAKGFVERMIKSGHGAMLEHGTVYLIIPFEYIDMSEQFDIPIVSDIVEKYKNNPYTKWRLRDDGFSQLAFITTNYRVLVENNWMDDLQYVCEPTEYHEKRITVRFICDRGVSHEFVRHRVFSFAQESTRYCNYSKDKFGNELTFIIPCWADSLALQEVKGTIINHDEYGNLIGEYYYHLTGKEGPWFKPWEITPERNFIANLQISEQLYLELLNQGWKPQQARAVLPNSLKTELVMTGTIEQWEGFFKLRDAKDAHPQARELAQPLHEEFIKRGLIKA